MFTVRNVEWVKTNNAIDDLDNIAGPLHQQVVSMPMKLCLPFHTVNSLHAHDAEKYFMTFIFITPTSNKARMSLTDLLRMKHSAQGYSPIHVWDVPLKVHACPQYNHETFKYDARFAFRFIFPKETNGQACAIQLLGLSKFESGNGISMHPWMQGYSRDFGKHPVTCCMIFGTRKWFTNLMRFETRDSDRYGYICTIEDTPGYVPWSFCRQSVPWHFGVEAPCWNTYRTRSIIPLAGRNFLLTLYWTIRACFGLPAVLIPSICVYAISFNYDAVWCTLKNGKKVATSWGEDSLGSWCDIEATLKKETDFFYSCEALIHMVSRNLDFAQIYALFTTHNAKFLLNLFK